MYSCRVRKHHKSGDVWKYIYLLGVFISQLDFGPATGEPKPSCTIFKFLGQAIKISERAAADLLRFFSFFFRGNNFEFEIF